MMKRAFRGLLALAIVAVVVFAVGATAETGMIYGSGEGITRAEWLHDLVVLFDMRIEEGNAPEDYFRDVADGNKYYTDILKAVEFGVVDIPAGGEVRPEDPLTRMFAADTLAYCLGYDTEETMTYSFSDVSAVSDPNAAQVALDRGWFQPVGKAFSPDRVVTEAEIRGMESSAKAILAASEFEDGHENSYTFADGVLVIPEDVTVAVEDMETLYIYDTDYAGRIKAGERFVFWMNDIPQAFIPDDVSVAGSYLVVTGAFEAADDESAITEMDAQGQVNADLVQVQAADGVGLTWYEGGTAPRLYADGTAYTSRAAAAKKQKNIKAVKLTKTFDLGSGVKSTASIFLENMKITYKTNVLEKYAYVDLTGKATITGSVSVNAVKLLGASGKILLGTVPVYGVASINIYLVYGLDGKVAVTYTANFEAGFEYDRGSRRSIASFVKKSYTMETQINAKLGLRADAGIHLGVVSGGLWAETGAKAEYKTKDWNDGQAPAVCRSLRAWLYAGMGYQVKVFGFDVLSDSLTIFDFNNSPVRMAFHNEDGAWVPVCTRDPAETYFTTKWDSRFGGLGNGYGFDGEGNWVPVFTFEVFENDKVEKVARITGYTGGAYALTIPDTVSDDGGEYKVVSIKSGAFRGRTDLHNVIFPESLLEIQDHAFFGCTSLEQVILPDDVAEIGAFAFAKCTDLTWLELPKNIKKIHGGAFAMTSHLTEVTIPKSLEETTSEYDPNVKYGYHYGVFMESTGLKRVNFEAGTTTVVNGLLANTPGLESVTIPEGVTSISANALNSCVNLAEVNLPSTLTKICDHAFFGCAALPGIDIPNAVTEILEFAFAKCDSLTDVHLPDALTKVGGGAFGACNALTAIEIPARIQETNTAYDNAVKYGYHYGVFMNCENLTDVTFRPGISKIAVGLFANTLGLKTITIPDTVTVIATNAFQSCTYLEHVNFSKNLVRIEGSAFNGCSSLKELNLPDTVTFIGGFAFASAVNLTELVLPKNIVEIDGGAFAKCDSLVEVTIPKTFTKTSEQYDPGIHYGYEAGIFLEGMGPKKIIIEEGTEVINYSAYGFTRGVEEIVLPESLKRIESRAFVQCNALKKINLPESLSYLGPNVFSSCKGLTEITVPSGITQLYENTFENCVSLAKVTLPEGLTSIGSNVFRDNALPGIDLPKGLKSIGATAFRGNAALTSIEIPASVTKIDNSCFMECTALEEVTLNVGLETVGAYAFKGDKALKAIVLPDSVTSIGKEALMDCETLADVTLSEGLTQLPDSLFANDPALKTVQVPYRVTKLGAKVFQNDMALTDVTLLAAVQSVGGEVFSYPAQLTIHGVSGSYAETYANDNNIRFAPLGDVPVTSLKASPEAVTMNTGETVRIALSIEPRDFTGEVTWETTKSGSEIIRIDENGSGEIRALKVGEAKVRISAGDEVIDVPVTVNQLVSRIWIDMPSYTMSVNDTMQLTAEVGPDNATNKAVTWSSSDESVLTVDENGLVTALKKGEARITVTAADGGGTNTSKTISVPNVLYRVDGPEGLESPHNYENSCTDIWEYTAEGAKTMDLVFDTRTSLEEEYDYLIITDGAGKRVGDSADGFTGAELSGATVRVNSDTVRLQLNTGKTGTDWGFKVVSVILDADADPDFTLPASLKRIEDEAFMGGGFFYPALPDGAESIGARAFANCAKLRHIYIPASVTAIAEDAFEGDSGVVIHGEAGSEAQRFAQKKGFAFIGK